MTRRARLAARSPDASMRELAAFGLGLAEAKSAADALIRTLRDATCGVRANAAWALGRMRADARCRRSSALFARQSTTRCATAAVMRGGADGLDERGGGAHRACSSDDQSPRVRRVAAWALGNIEGARLRPTLSNALAHDADARVREMSAWALGDMRSAERGRRACGAPAQRQRRPRARDRRVGARPRSSNGRRWMHCRRAAQGDANPRVRGTAAWAIGQLDDRGVTAPAALLKALRDDSDDVRLKAAWALGQLGDRNAVSADTRRTEQGSRTARCGAR